MTWHEFFAGEEDLIALLTLCIDRLDLDVWEAHPPNDIALRQFISVGDIEAAYDIGDERVVLTLWSDEVGPPPQVRRIDLRSGGFREQLLGLGSFSLHLGAADSEALMPSTFGYHSAGYYASPNESGMTAELSQINWEAQSRIAFRIEHHINELWAVGRAIPDKNYARRLPVHAGAISLTKGGAQLRGTGKKPLTYHLE